MPDTKTTALTENTTPVSTDIIYMVDDPGGSALSQKMTLATMRAFIKATGGRELISEQTPTGTGTVTWSSIPATYKSLEIEYVARGTQAATAINLNLYFNNDTTATNYRSEWMYGTGTAASVAQADNAIIAPVSAASATANLAGYGTIKIINYASTTFNKQAFCITSLRDSATGMYIWTASIDWESTTAINRVDIVTSAGNYDTGTTFRLYGVY